MTIREFYEKINGDYEGTILRLRKEELIKKYVLKSKECNDMDNLTNSLKEGDWSSAFRYSHNLKGLCANLGFTVLGESSSRLCELLRPYGTLGSEAPSIAPDTSNLYNQVVVDFKKLVEAIAEIE